MMMNIVLVVDCNETEKKTWFDSPLFNFQVLYLGYLRSSGGGGFK